MIALLSDAVRRGGMRGHGAVRTGEGAVAASWCWPHGIPSHDAFSDLFNALDPGAMLQRVLLRLLEDWSALLEDDVIAIDGKSLRRSFADAAARSPVHLVQAFAARARLVLGQVKVADKSNEIAAMPKLLEMLALKGRIVTADAMHTQRAAAESITARGGDYVLALKGNQASLHDRACPRRGCGCIWSDPARADELRSCQQVDGDHGRIETRCATVCHEVASLVFGAGGGCGSAMTGRGWPPSARSRRGAKPPDARQPKPATTS